MGFVFWFNKKIIEKQKANILKLVTQLEEKIKRRSFLTELIQLNTIYSLTLTPDTGLLFFDI